MGRLAGKVTDPVARPCWLRTDGGGTRKGPGRKPPDCPDPGKT